MLYLENNLASHAFTQRQVALLTARSREEDIVTDLRAGANDYLVKPTGREELLARVRTQLELKRSVQRLREHERLREEISRREAVEEKLEGIQRRVIRDLNEESGLWSATLDPRGTYSTRTLNKYLNTRTLPKNPRWRIVVQTATFVLNHCPETAPELREALQEKLQLLEDRLLILD